MRFTAHSQAGGPAVLVTIDQVSEEDFLAFVSTWSSNRALYLYLDPETAQRFMLALDLVVKDGLAAQALREALGNGKPEEM